MFHVCKRTSSGISSIPIRSVDFEKRMVYLDDEITYQSADQFIEQIIYLNRQSNNKITVFINADGLQKSAAGGICDILKLSQSPIKAICTCRAFNMAAVVFMFADERIMFPNAVLSFEQTEHQMGFIQTKDSSLKSIMPSLNKKAIDLIKRKTIITAQDAVKYGLADKICDISDLEQERGNGLWI